MSSSKDEPPQSSSQPSSRQAQPSLQRKQTLVQQSSQAATDMTRRMICGGLAGCIAKTATNPLERIKMLSQTGEHSSKSGSVVSLYRAIIKNEGIIGLWAGNGANLLRVFPAKAVVFSTNDMFQAMFRKLSHTPDHQKLHHTYAFLSGGLAGVCASLATYHSTLHEAGLVAKWPLHLAPKKSTRALSIPWPLLYEMRAF